MVGIQKNSVGRLVVSVSVSHPFWLLAKEHHIGLSEATRVGIAIMLHDLGLPEFANHLNITRKLHGFQARSEDLAAKITVLKQKIKDLTPNGS